MTTNNKDDGTPTDKEQSTTPQQELTRLTDELKASTTPLASAVRKHLLGHDVDVSSIRLLVMKNIDAVVAQISPTATPRGPLSYLPGELIDSYWDRIDERREYAATGFKSLNQALSGGFEQDRLVVLNGAPGSGKTTFINQVADHVASIKRPVLYVTSEDTPHMLLAKTIARRGKLDYSVVQRGVSSEREKITAALKEYRDTTNARFLRYVDATQGLNLDGIYEQSVAHFNALKSEASGAPLLVVDYLQRLARFENLGQDLRHSITVYTERLRALACDLHATVVVLCAMNRASGYHAGNSTIASAKESGDIDYTADCIMAIGAQDGEDQSVPELRPWMLRIDKNRQGYVTYDEHHIYLDWYAARQQFTEREYVRREPAEAGSNGRYGRRGGR